MADNEIHYETDVLRLASPRGGLVEFNAAEKTVRIETDKKTVLIRLGMSKEKRGAAIEKMLNDYFGENDLQPTA